MGLIAKIKSYLGVAGNGQEGAGDRPPAAVDDDPETDEPEASSERAVKGVDRASDSRSPGTRAGSTDRAAGAASGPAATEDEPSEAQGEPVDSIKGIGGAYAQRLADAGVHSVADLARADPEELAAATDLGTGRVGKWIERARARTE